MDKFKGNIDRQIESSQGKNIFLDEDNTLRFLQETVNCIDRIGEIDEAGECVLIDYATDKTLQEFCRVNQYYSFDSVSKNSLREIYVNLFSDIRDKKIPIEKIAKSHYRNLRCLLQETNPFAERIYSTNDKIVQPVVCSEYRSDMQIDILQIDISDMMEPVLDIGCGKQGIMVKYLREMGIDAYGIDRFSDDSSYFTNADWLEYDYGSVRWGTIISNLGFSNHFRHHHFRTDGNFIGYAKKYMEILNSLKTGGRFHYAPDVPFIESLLDKQKYQVVTKTIENSEAKTTIIRRLIK